MNFAYKGLILYLAYIVLLTIAGFIWGYGIKVPDIKSMVFGLAFITWIGIGDILEAQK